MKPRNKNPVLRDLIMKLQKKSLEKDAPVWKAVAKGLNRPKRKRYEVNLFRIEKHAKSRETLVVPGTVLGTGNIKRTVTVAAVKFSGNAKEKIEKAGGKCLSIEELMEKNPNGSKIRIMG